MATDAPLRQSQTPRLASLRMPADPWPNAVANNMHQLALLLGTTGSIITALSLNAARARFARPEFLKAGALVVSLAFLVMEFRASSYWRGLRNLGNALAQALRFEPFPTSLRWNPLTTSGAGFYLHALVAMLWLASLLLRFQPGL